MVSVLMKEQRRGRGRPRTGEAKPDRHATPKIQFHVYDPEIIDALNCYLEDQKFKVDKTAVLNKILEDFLAIEGYWDAAKKRPAGPKS